jgi:hypothetical protein
MDILLSNYLVSNKLMKEIHKPGEAEPYICKILYNGFIIMGKMING